MNDNDIINTFEHCMSTTCDYRCPRWDDVPTKTLTRTLCRVRLCREMLEVAKRQKAEIERLKAECENQYNIAEATIRSEIADGGTSCHWCMKQHKAKAFKEFAEKLHEKLYGITTVYNSHFGRMIDNLVKEMTEGDNEKRRPV